MTTAEGVGATGVALLLVAFGLTSFGLLDSRSATYHTINLIGASLSCAASTLIGFAPFVVLEGAWALVALVALVRAVWVGCGRLRADQPRV